MKPTLFNPTASLVAIICAIAGCGVAGPTSGAEISATHVVFEKPAKMKKADTHLYLPLVDQSRKSDSAEASRRVDCRVFAEQRRGPLPVKGTFRLRVLGETTRSGNSWQSSAITAPLDTDGRGTFEPAAIADLVAEAEAAGAAARLMRIEFDGAKGKKVTKLTVDCENWRAES